jgi:hypothetical protein
VKNFVENIELWLSGAGLLVVWIASVILAPGSDDVWKVAAVTALGVSVLHGALFWVVRRRQRRIRRASIYEIREMLTDGVLNELAVIQMFLPQDRGDEADMAVEGIKDSVTNISTLVDGLSEESLTEWKAEYREAVANATDIRMAA